MSDRTRTDYRGWSTRASEPNYVKAARSRRLDKFIMLVIGVMLGYFLGVCTMNYIANAPIPEKTWQVQGADSRVIIFPDYAGQLLASGKATPLQPDVEATPPVDQDEVICDCIEFIEGEAEERQLGTLCRCDIPGEGISWIFEGGPEGLTQLYLYLKEGVEQYYDQLQEKRWPRHGLPEKES